jgi:hypothetical protein
MKIIELKEYVDMRFCEAEKARKDSLIAIDQVRVETAHALEKRLESMNEFRDQLRQQQNTFLTKSVYDVQHQNLDLRVQGKVGCDEYRAFTNTANDILEDYKINKAVLATRASSNGLIWGYVFTGITLVIAVIDLILRFVK